MARIHAILFPHDAPDVVGRRLRGANLFHAGGLLDDKKIREVLQVFFVTEKGEADQLMKSVFGRSCLMPRSYVLAQWLFVLKALNHRYRHFNMDPVCQSNLEHRLACLRYGWKCDAEVIDDERLLKYERSIGA